MELWIIFVLLYGIFKGIREPVKKKALEKTDVLSTLFMYTFIGFLLSTLTARDVFSLSGQVYFIIFIKSAVLFFAWIAAFESIKRIPVSLYGVVNMSRVIFSTLMGVIILGEHLNATGVISLILVAAGVGFAGGKKSVKKENCSYKDIFLTLASCVLNAASGTIDKYIMTKHEITGAQLQFWFMLMVSLMYLGYIIFKKQKPDIRGSLKNPYIYIMSILLVFGDRLLFDANANAESSVVVMTLIKQSSVLVTIASGKIIYKEKNILRKTICAAVIIAGILIAVL